MEKDIIFNAFVNHSLADLDDPERFWKCWRLNDCGTCLNRGDGCGWCPYVRKEVSVHRKFESSSDFYVASPPLKHMFNIRYWISSSMPDFVSVLYRLHVIALWGFHILMLSPPVCHLCPSAPGR
jgi:hypothetical protein